jgi:hypothetical protein
MFSENIALQFGHLFSCAEETCHFNLTYCKYCITVWAFLSFIGRNMIFQSPLFLQILHQSLCICMVYFSYDLKKYDLSKYSFLQISHHSWGISKVYFSHVQKKYDLSNHIRDNKCVL